MHQGVESGFAFPFLTYLYYSDSASMTKKKKSLESKKIHKFFPKEC